jgi:microsomal epoxide hydrolase
MRLLLTACLLLLTLVRPALARDATFLASDGARLHYTVNGPRTAPVLLFVPGWTMPGWIFAPQMRAFDHKYEVVLFDPRGQGGSEITRGGYNQDRRGKDIGELIAHLHAQRVVVIGWSLGVLDTLAWVHAGASPALKGLVLIDNSVGENPPPSYEPLPDTSEPSSRAARMRDFVAGMFATGQSDDYIDRLTETCLRTPAHAAALLLCYPVPRSYWKNALLSTPVPVLYAVRPHLEAQAQNLVIDRPNTTIALFPKAGHALFVDEPEVFNALLQSFLTQKAGLR